jgi:MSHA biogenesis protein MshP
MVVVMSSTTSVQNLTTTYSLQQARAYVAASSGLDYGIQRAVSANACTNGGVTLPGISFTITVSCSPTVVNEAGISSTVYQITSTASTGTFGNVGYVTRTVRATVN